LTIFSFSEGEALQVLADFHGHGGGDKSNELVILQYEEIVRQQVKFSTTDKTFGGNIIPNSSHFGFQ
jgi:hypothetical protein